MEARNPSFDPPLLAPSSPAKRHPSKRSPSHSPTRSLHLRDHDPMLRDLSPTSTLRAFAPPATSHTSSRPLSPRQLTLKASFSTATSAQRTLGTKAAQACLDIRSWARELESWDWPDCYEEPEPARKRARFSILSIASLSSRKTSTTVDGEDESDERQEYWGSLPAATVQEHQRRLREIVDQLDTVDLDGLKAFVLFAHRLQKGEGKHGVVDTGGSIENIGAATDLDKLDDFTAIVTATILQTLPFLCRLDRLIELWTFRLRILERIPSFLDDLERLRTDLDHGWAAVAVSLRKDGRHATLGADHMREMQALIETRLISLAKRLDTFLDLLEGEDDSVPEMFLDKFEEVEERFAEWVVMAQRRVLGDELKRFETDLSRARARPRSARPDPSGPSQLAQAFELEDTSTARMTWYESDPDQTRWYESSDDADLTRETRKSKLLRQNGQAVQPHGRSGALPPFSLSAESLTSSHVSSKGDKKSTGELLFPSPPRKTHVRPESPSRHVRHVPIVLSLDGDGSEYTTSPMASTAHLPETTNTVETITNHGGSPIDADTYKFAVDQKPPISIFTTPRPSADTDRTSSSSQRKPLSPGRPFEHASNAFSRLFKREKSPDQSRALSPKPGVAAGFIRGRGSGSGKRESKINETTLIWGGRHSFAHEGEKVPAADVKALMQKRTPDRTSEHVGKSGERHPRDNQQPRPALHEVTEQPGLASTTEEAVVYTPVASPHDAGHTLTIALPEDDTRPQTYQPRRLSSPFASPTEHNVPDNWPLVSPSEGLSPVNAASPERRLGETDDPLTSSSAAAHPSSESTPAPPRNLTTVRSMHAIGSDDFHRFFIDGLPAQEEQESIIEQTTLAQADYSEQRPHTPAETTGSTTTASPPSDRKVREPVVVPTMLSSDGRQDDLSVARAISIEALNSASMPATRPKAPDRSRDERVSSFPTGLDEEMIGTPEEDMEVRHASVGYFGVAATPLQDSEAGTSTGERKRPESMNAIEAKVVEVVIPPFNLTRSDSVVPLLPSQDANKGKGQNHKDLKRASVASIQSHARSEVRNIEVPARSRPSSNAGLSRHLSDPQVPRVPWVSAYSRDSAATLSSSLTAEAELESDDRNPASLLDERSATLDTLVGKKAAQVPEDQAPLNHAMAKKRNREVIAVEPDKTPSDTVAEPAKRQAPAAHTRKAKVEGDNFDRHVSQVLEKMPASIRFKTRSGVEMPNRAATPTTQRTAEPRNYSGPRPKAPASGVRKTAGPSTVTTITAAESTPRRTSPSDPEIKLYHLTQAGREEPIKLFVRLVGEGERVMVRVGGGWADLAEYLKQYAEHHGSRTVSGSGGPGVEVHTAESTPTTARRLSGSSAAGAERKPFGPGSRDSAAKNGWFTPSEGAGSPVSPTPGHHSRPPTADGASSSRPSSSGANSPWANGGTVDLGMAGPPLRKEGSKTALAEHKAKWVQDMLEQTKREAGSARDSKAEPFGELGKIGSTRRVVFRSPSAMGDAPGKEGGGG